MQKYTACILCIFLIIALLPACTRDAALTQKDDTPHIVVTIFPAYDWARAILGEQLSQTNLTLLADNGVDLHSYQPTADDIVTISTCDLFVYVGGETDHWVEDALSEAVNQEMVVINLLEALGDAAKEEEAVDGMEAGEHEGDGDAGYDEHVWLSLKNAKVLCRILADAISELDSAHEQVYASNAAIYIESLEELDKAYHEAVDKAEYRTLLFGDRFPFRYLVDDYDLSYYAAFDGCSAETEASFETIVFLADKADEHKLNTILKTESSDGSVAETIRQNTKTKNQKILTMDSMQSVTMSDVTNGVTYRSVMENNLKALKEALS